MEKRKLLLVSITVGIFLVISIVAGMLILQQKNEPSAAAVASGSAQTPDSTNNTDTAPFYQPPQSNTASHDPVELINDVPGLKPAPEGMASGNSDYYISNSNTGQETVITVRTPTTAAVPETAPAGKAASSSRPASASRSTNTTSQPVRPAAQTGTAAKSTREPKGQNDFWVQTGAFSTITKAEGVKSTLASKGITSIIENRDVNGQTLFRVRVGPYTSQNEANYWLSLIKSINGFEDSQVRQTVARR